MSIKKAARDTEAENFASRYPEVMKERALIKEAKAIKILEPHLIPFDVARCHGNDQPICATCLRRLQIPKDPAYMLNKRRWTDAIADENGCNDYRGKSNVS